MSVGWDGGGTWAARGARWVLFADGRHDGHGDERVAARAPEKWWLGGSSVARGWEGLLFGEGMVGGKVFNGVAA